MYSKKIILISFLLIVLKINYVSAQLVISTGASANITRTPSTGATAGTVTYTATSLASAANLNVSSINADLVNGYNVTIDYTSTTQNLTLNTDLIISADMANDATLTFKAAKSVVVNPSLDIDATQNANTKKLHLLFWADSDNSGMGQIMLSEYTSTSMGLIKTNGGNITMSGGATPATDYAHCDNLGSSLKPFAGIRIHNTQMDANGGNILMRAAVLSASGTGHSIRALYIESTVAGQDCILKTTGTGTINLYGDCTNASSGSINPWGITFATVTVQTAAGAINMFGAGGPMTNGNIRGHVLSNVDILSATGNIAITDLTDGAAATPLTNYTGTLINGNCNIGKGSLSSATGTITISADKLGFSSNNEFNTTNHILFQAYHGNSFLATLTIPATNNFYNASQIDFGAAANTSDITLATDANAIPLSGPMNIYGNNLTINRALSGAGQTIKLSATTSATQSASAILTAQYLALLNSGSFTLPSLNVVNTLAAGTVATPITNLSFRNNTTLNIGAVPSLATGINASGTIVVATQSGDLNVNNDVLTTNASLPAISMYADSTRMSGDGSGGQMSLATGVSVAADPSGQVRLYSGRESASIGFPSYVSSSNVRTYVDRTTASFTPSLSTGVYALYRIDASVLPIHLLAFTGTCTQNAAVLNWSTANGLQDQYFEVQNSVDGIKFNTVAQIKGQDLATEAQYQYQDMQPKAQSWYRLKLVDRGGLVQYSNTLMMSCGAAHEAPLVTIYPNPVHDVVRLHTNFSDFAYKLCDLMGNKVAAGTATTTDIQIPVSGLASGIYFLQLTSAQAIVGTYKIMIP